MARPITRTRKIKPGYNDSEPISRLSHSARLMDICLWCHLDGNGMILASPMSIKAQVFPLDEIPASQVTLWISELIRAGRLFSLEVDGKRWLYRKDFRKEQKIYADEPRKCTVNPELLNQCDRGEYLTPTAYIGDGEKVDVNLELFVTSPSTSTFTSTSPSKLSTNLETGNGDKSGQPVREPPPLNFFSNLIQKFKAQSEARVSEAAS